jgi:hypothetical protein
VVSTIFFAKSSASISISSDVYGWLLSKLPCYGSASCRELTRGDVQNHWGEAGGVLRNSKQDV